MTPHPLDVGVRDRGDHPGRPIAPTDLERAYLAALDAGPIAQARVIWWALRHDHNVEASTAERIGATVVTFAARQATLGRDRLVDTTPEDAAGFVWANTLRGIPPAIATVHLRRSALRLAFRTIARLAGPTTDPTSGLSLPPKTRSELRPLDDDEATLLRIAASGRTRSRSLVEATVALAEATATTGEIATLRWRHLAPDRTQLRLPGAGRIRARTGQLTPWGKAALDRLGRTVAADPDAPIVYRGGAAAGSQAAQAAIVNRLRHLLREAGLDGRDLRPTSIRLWQPARRLAAGGRIEDIANQLGLASLDVACAQLGHHWQDG